MARVQALFPSKLLYIFLCWKLPWLFTNCCLIFNNVSETLYVVRFSLTFNLSYRFTLLSNLSFLLNFYFTKMTTHMPVWSRNSQQAYSSSSRILFVFSTKDGLIWAFFPLKNPVLGLGPLAGNL